MNGEPLCFGTGLKPEGQACRIKVTPAGLDLTVDGPAPSHETVPFRILAVEPGGFELNHLVLKWTQSGRERMLYVRDSVTMDLLAAAAPPELKTSLDRAARKVRKSRRSPFVLIGAFVIVVALLFTTLFLTFDLLIDGIVSHVPRSWDRALGESAYNSLVSGSERLETGPAVDAVQEVAGRIRKSLGPEADPTEVTVVKSPTVNAFALPGGRIVVYTGLLTHTDSAEELASVLGHEMSHVTLRHSVRRLVRGAGISVLVMILAGDQAGLSETARNLGMELVNLSYDRKQETEADLEGVKLLARAGVSPDGMVTFFERLSHEEPRLIPLLSTHPMSAERAALIKQAIAKLPPDFATRIPIDWSEVKKAAE